MVELLYVVRLCGEYHCETNFPANLKRQAKQSKNRRQAKKKITKRQKNKKNSNDSVEKKKKRVRI